MSHLLLSLECGVPAKGLRSYSLAGQKAQKAAERNEENVIKVQGRLEANPDEMTVLGFAKNSHLVPGS